MSYDPEDEPPLRSGYIVFEGAGERDVSFAYEVWRATDPDNAYVEIACDEGHIALTVPEGLVSDHSFAEYLAGEMAGTPEMRYLLSPAEYVVHRTIYRHRHQTHAELFAELLEDSDPEIRLAAMTALRDEREGAKWVTE